jgi:hypothetical protein
LRKLPSSSATKSPSAGSYGFKSARVRQSDDLKAWGQSIAALV